MKKILVLVVLLLTVTLSGCKNVDKGVEKIDWNYVLIDDDCYIIGHQKALDVWSHKGYGYMSITDDSHCELEELE